MTSPTTPKELSAFDQKTMELADSMASYDAFEDMRAAREALRQHLISAAPKAEQATSAAQGLTDDEVFAQLGRDMYAMTTTVHSPNIPFAEACAIIPGLWLRCVEDRDAALSSQDTRRDGGREDGNG